MLKSAILILSGNAAASAFLLIRNLLIARLIPVADYGIAATFAVAMAVVEMASAFGLQQQIVQSKKGDDPEFQANLQGFQLLRGVISALILFLMASPLARFLGIPEVAWAYQVLAVVPVLNALQHFDIHRMTREMKFKALILTGSAPALITLIAVWPMNALFGDWRVMLWALVAQATIAALVSHWCAERPWKLALDRAAMAETLRFGWPLMLNSILMFLVFQGDKLIVGRLQGMEALAIFSMGMTLLLTPTLVFAKSAQNLFLPKLSAPESKEAFAFMSQQCLQIASIASVALVVATLIVGGPIVFLLLGEKYSDLIPLLLWFAISQGLRMQKAGPAIVSLAVGQTSNALWSNVVRVLVLPVAYIAAQAETGLLIVLLIASAGEYLGVIIAVVLMNKRVEGLQTTRIFVEQNVCAFVMLFIGCIAWLQPELLPQQSLAPFGAILLGLFALLLCLAPMREAQQKILSLVKRT